MHPDYQLLTTCRELFIWAGDVACVGQSGCLGCLEVLPVGWGHPIPAASIDPQSIQSTVIKGNFLFFEGREVSLHQHLI